MKNLLVFSFFPAFTPPQSGGEVRLFYFYSELSKYFNITLLSSAHLGGQIEEIWHTSHFRERRIPKDGAFADEWQRLTPHAGAGDLSGPCIAESGKYFTPLHKAYLDEYKNADLVIHDSPFSLPYDIFRGLDKKPRIYNSYNCEYELYKKLHSSNPSEKISNLIKDLEIEILQSADLVTYCGEDDMASFEQMVEEPLANALFLPNGMIAKPRHNHRSISKPKRAIFIGSGHLPNVEAAKFIAESIAPSCPELTFDIVGNCLPPGNYVSNVTRHGLVDSKLKADLLRTADIAVNPMLTGGGSSLKILDFVAHGIPLFSTPLGIRGFDFKNKVDCILIEAQAFTTAIKDYSADPLLLARIAKSALGLAERRYTWKIIASKFRDAIDKLLPSPTSGQKSDRYVISLNDYNPFEAVGGGATRLHGLYSAIAEKCKVVVLCFSNSNVFGAARMSNGIHCVQVPKTIEHLNEEIHFNSRFHISANDIVALRHVARNTVISSIYNILRTDAIIVICEHPYMSPLPINCGDRFIYSSQNYEIGLKNALLEWHPDKNELLADVKAAESICVSSSALVIAVSDQDGFDFSKGVRACAPVKVIPNGAAIPTPPTENDVKSANIAISANSAVFLGSAHMPNVEALSFIVEVLAVQCSEIVFHIVGSVCSALPKNLPKNVVAWGVLNNSMKSAVLQKCAVAINPMFTGSGSNVKLADFLANGLYVVSTAFGIRGYPQETAEHVSIADRSSFSKILTDTLNTAQLNSTNERQIRQHLFDAKLSMKALGGELLKVIENLQAPRKKMLFVTYRYTYPFQGGAEYYLSKLIAHVGKSGIYTIDVVAPEVSTITEKSRFSSTYSFDSKSAAPPEMENVRFARFPLTSRDSAETRSELAAAWRSQSNLERLHVTSASSVPSKSFLAWGWGHPETKEKSKARWAFTECGIYVDKLTKVRIAGFAPAPTACLVSDADGYEILHQKLESGFDIEFEAQSGFVNISLSKTMAAVEDDPRPLAIYVQKILLNDLDLDLGAPVLQESVGENPLQTYIALEAAAHASRGRDNVSLTEIRGPHSQPMESFISSSITNYDLIVTHNSVFKPAAFAVKIAKTAGVSSILIPHAHLDDDFYHFPDVHQAALDADLVLASPIAACDFYTHLGSKKVKYHSPGIDITEEFSNSDENDFRRLFHLKTPFFLVLGRKAGAKGYLEVIDEIDKLAASRNIHLVMIGPDEDHMSINSTNVTYLGQQPRSVVRGALRSAIALVNMSSSESFGMVLLESWLAGRPVIVNRNCSAFRDIAIHEQNALLASKESLGASLDRLASDDLLCTRLGCAGKETVKNYDWQNVCESFLNECNVLTK